MKFGKHVVALVNSTPIFASVEHASKIRRGFPIHGYVGANGSGKSLAAALDTAPTLSGVQWHCDLPDHLHTAEGVTSGLRKVLSTMRFTTPEGDDHPLWVPLTDFSQIISAEHVDLILDEVGGAVASSSSDDIPLGVKASLQELRRRDVVCRWTAPSWSRASKVLRETSQAVTLVQGKMSVKAHVGVHFDGQHMTEFVNDDFILERKLCDIDGSHEHDAGKLWGARRLMLFRTYDATIFEEWTAGKRKQQKPVVRSWLWRPGSLAESIYDTHAYVEKLNQITQGGVCDHCGGTKRRPACSCGSTHARRTRVTKAASEPVTQ